LKKLFVGEFNLKRLMTSLLLIPLFVYLGLLIFAYFFADKLIFQPQFSSYKDNSEIIKLTTSNGEKISAKFYPNPNATHTILFCHGNAEDLNTAGSMLKEFQKNGFAVLTFDYRGYGTSEGFPTEENVYRDADAAYEYLTNELKIPPEKIIVHGRSLGGAVAIDLASRQKVGGLIVESSFVSAFRVLTSYQITPFDKFKNLDKIKQVKCPVLFIHGRKDQIIPFWHGEKLFAEANEPKFSFWIDEAGHNNIYQTGGKAYLQRIRDFADNLPK
jgi:abhydrolase domain-containing protein 17